MKQTLNFAQATNLAFNHAMEANPNVFVYGLDVADHKGILGTTIGLEEKFGSKRCFSTPLSEDAMTGVALGAAASGLRPVHTHIRVDFVLLCMNQLVNMISTTKYLSNGKLNAPLVVRALIGRGWGQGPQHSKSLQSYFAHIPGLKVVMPTTPQDGYSMMRKSIEENCPVVYLEHRWLHYISGEVDTEQEIDLSKAKVVKEGNDLTIVSSSWMTVESIKAAEILSKAGLSVEVIDLKSISPIDWDTIINSVSKTKSCLIADYDWVTCGVSSEIAATVNEKCFGQLSRPTQRIGFKFTPCPTTRPLEDEFYPDAKSIIRRVEMMMDLPNQDLTSETFYSYEEKFKGPF
ncbi:MAG: hypothetical protein NXH75_08505 [Halobacteriovoraceae bacterium]|nr:hypothetical protein [Halobacteriovoraceae bacterium]